MARIKEHLIWSNIDTDGIVDNEFYDENYPDMSEQERIDDTLETWLNDERMNLDKKVNTIIVIADLGLWNGRKQGYKLIGSGNLRDILSSDSDLVKWYSDGKDIKCENHHHDGTNYYLYREVKNGVDIDNLLNSIYNGETISRQKLSYYTRSIEPYINEVYGWHK